MHSDEFLRQIRPDTGEPVPETSIRKAPPNRTGFGQPIGSQIRGTPCCLEMTRLHGVEAISIDGQTGSCVRVVAVQNPADQGRPQGSNRPFAFDPNGQ